jgi:prepilin-type N-terminal cleavage/methylation domain-containing protein
MTCRRKLSQRGISLIELLMALAVTALLMAPVVAMLDTSVDAGAAASNRRVIEQEVNFALERIAAQVRATSRKRLDPNTLVSDSESWFAARFFKQGDQLVEKFGGTDRVIADGVSMFSITAKAVGADNTLVEASLEQKRGADIASGTIVLRLGGAP